MGIVTLFARLLLVPLLTVSPPPSTPSPLFKALNLEKRGDSMLVSTSDEIREAFGF